MHTKTATQQYETLMSKWEIYSNHDNRCNHGNMAYSFGIKIKHKNFKFKKVQLCVYICEYSLN